MTTTDPIAFFRDELPALFRRGVTELDGGARAGDAEAARRVGDTRSARGSVVVVVEGDDSPGRVLLDIANGDMQSVDAPAHPVRVAVAAPAEALRAGLEAANEAGLFERPSAATRVARLASRRVEQMLEGQTITFHLVLKDAPDLDDVTVRVGLGVAEPPDRPQFTAVLKYEHLEALRDREITVLQLLLGKLRIQGDASRALAIATKLLEKR